MAFTYEVCPLIFATVGNTISTVDLSDSVMDFPLVVYTAAYDDTISSTKWPFHKRTDGYISGTTIDETAGVMSNVIITCLWNKNMALVSRVRSDVNGIWRIDGLDPTDTYGYTITAQDPTTGVVYNTVSYDKIIPV